MITKEDVEKLAVLARIEIADDEKEKLQNDLESILGYVSELTSVVGEFGVREKDELLNVMREDAGAHEPGAFTEKILNNAPRSEGGYVAVKQIIER